MRSSTVVRRAHVATRDEAKQGSDDAASTDDHHEVGVRSRRKKVRRRMLNVPGTKGLFCLIIILPPTIVLSLAAYFYGTRTKTGRFLRWSKPLPQKFRICLPMHGTKAIRHPKPWVATESDDGKPDRGKLKVLRPNPSHSIIFGPDDEIFEDFKPADDESLRKSTDAYYYAFDDDEKRNPIHHYSDKHAAKSQHCRRVSWHRDFFPNCNEFHSIDVPRRALAQEVSYIGGGSYRNVFLLEEHGADPEMILKVAEIELDYKTRDYEFMRVEGNVNAAIAPHPLIVDSFGFCALSLFSEAMMNGDVEKKAIPIYRRRKCNRMEDMEGHRLIKMNEIDGTTKLEYALQMAEAVALLHNHKNGVIIHDDIQLPQFMVTADGKLKMGDFNRAEIILYDEEHGNYCKYRNGAGHGDWRSPEEYKDYPLDEKIDIWSLGTNFYGLLTGLAPFYELCKDKEAAKRIKKGETPFIHPGWEQISYAESMLVKIIRQCWTIDPNERPSIRDLIFLLRQAVKHNREQQYN